MMVRAREQMLVHFYRAVVGHMDVWRQRMDATTNWAAATSAGMITFAFGTSASPHFVLLLALGFQGVFLLMESRRYQIYDLWRRRFRVLNQHLVVPVLREDADLAAAATPSLDALAADLGRTVPHLSLVDSVGYRIRRNYGYLFMVTLVAWVLHLETQPGAAATMAEFAARARVGLIPGPAVLGVVAAAAAAGLALSLRAPSERMLDWTAIPAPLARWQWWGRRERGAGTEANPGSGDRTDA